MWSDDSSTARAFHGRHERGELRRAMKAAGIDAPVHYDDVIESTNTKALHLAELGEPEWSLVAAGHQTGGRGRLGRSWASEPGTSLLFSFLLRPPLPADRALLLTLLTGAAMAEACAEVAGVDVRCKWPNDLVLGEGKLGGILAEARVRDGRIQHVVVGVGVNLTAVPRGVEGGAALGPVDRAALLTAFFRGFRDRYHPAGEGFAHAVISAYAPLSATLGKRVRASTTGGHTVEGTVVDLNPDGNLVLDTDEGRAVVGFGEVHHLR